MHIGTGEGSQVYGWGLYGASVRGVAEKYAYESSIRHKDRETGETPPEFIYEQTFFTDRAPGDESHLLKWYEPVSEEQRKWVEDALLKEFDWDLKNERYLLDALKGADGGKFYGGLQDILVEKGDVDRAGSARAASEFLVRAGIDGVKYPVDSYGGKTVKDGDKAGWNYVSFRDDNIRVDHKWTDGEQRYSIVSLAGRDVAVAETEPLTTREAQNETKVREVLMPIVGQEFPQRGETVPVMVDEDMPNEFWSSAYSQMVRRKYEKLWRAKVSAIPILGEILQTTSLGPAEAARHINRKFKDRATFYRCQSEFGIKRWDGVAVYPCELLLLEVDGVRYVYDFVNIKKPTLTAKGDLDEATLRRLYNGGTPTGESATSVPEGTENSLPQLPAGVNGVAAPAVLAAAVARGEDERKAAEKKGEEDGAGSARASVAPPPRRASSPYPSLLGMSDEDLVAAALAARMATGAESSLDKTPGVSSSQTYGGIKRSTVEGFLRRVRPSASDAEIAALLDTTARKARDMAKIIRHDIIGTLPSRRFILRGHSLYTSSLYTSPHTGPFCRDTPSAARQS